MVQNGLRGGIPTLMTNVHVYGRDVDLFKRVFWGEMPQAAEPWHAYHDYVVNLIQETCLIKKTQKMYIV